MKIFFVLAVLLLVQSAWSLVDGRRFLALVRKSRRQAPGDYAPFAALIVPFKNIEPGLELNLASLCGQDYPAYQLIAVVASPDEPVYGWLKRQLDRGGLRADKTALVVGGHSATRGEKVNNLLAGVAASDPAAEVFVFADSDATPGRDWLRSLVAPLGDPAITVSTGFRWYLPGESFASQLRAAWDTSVATMLGEHSHNFAWGGSMAIRAADFRRLEVAERYWNSTVSDDYALTRAVRDDRTTGTGSSKSPGRIHFEPRCLVKSREDLKLRKFLAWANRQIIITRVYWPQLWRTGLVSYVLYCGTFVLGLALLASGAGTVGAREVALALLAAILALGAGKAAIRTVVAREVFREEAGTVARYGSRYWQLSPLVPWIMLFNFLVAAFVRRIEWSGVRYELRSASQVRVLD